MKNRFIIHSSLFWLLLVAACSPSRDIAPTLTEIVSSPPIISTTLTPAVSTTHTLTPLDTPTITQVIPISPTITLIPSITPTFSLNLPELIYDDFVHPMVLVPEGVFQMGMGIVNTYPDDPQTYPDFTEEENLYLLELHQPFSEDDDVFPPLFLYEAPLHSVFLDTFYIDKYEVTNYQYRSCVTAGYCEKPSKSTSWTQESYFDNPKFDDYPVIYVSWEDALSYCNWRGLRLPTEAEWEKAARGPEALIFPWGDTFSEPYANICDKNCTFKRPHLDIDDRYVDTSPVGFFPDGASPYGAMDMSGNVSEWVNDIFVSDYYQFEHTMNPPGPEHGDAIDQTSDGYIWSTDRVIRGGSFSQNKIFVRASSRWLFGIEESDFNIGFRCAMSVDTQ